MNTTIAAFLYIFVSCFIGIIFAYFTYLSIKGIPIEEDGKYHKNNKEHLEKIIITEDGLQEEEDKKQEDNNRLKNNQRNSLHFNWTSTSVQLNKISKVVTKYTKKFLKKRWLSIFICTLPFIFLVKFFAEQKIYNFWLVIPLILGMAMCSLVEYFTFKILANTSFKVAYYGISENDAIQNSFRTAVKSALIIGITILAISIMQISLLVLAYNYVYLLGDYTPQTYPEMLKNLAAFSLGCGLVTTASRIIACIYSQSAYIGGDLIPRIKYHLKENDCRNPSIYSKLIGENISSISSSSDNFFAVSLLLSSSLYITSACPELFEGILSMNYSILLNSTSLLLIIFLSVLEFYFIHYSSIVKIQKLLKFHILFYSIALCPLIYCSIQFIFPDQILIRIENDTKNLTPSYISLCIIIGLFATLLLGLLTSYFSMSSRGLIKEIINACTKGTSIGLIYGLSYGYFSCIFISFILSIAVYWMFSLGYFFGLCMASIGSILLITSNSILSMLFPIFHNAVGAVNLLGLNAQAKKNLEDLQGLADDCKNISKGFELFQSIIISIVCHGAFLQTSGTKSLNILNPLIFCGIFVGGMIPYLISAIVLKIVGENSLLISGEIKKQIRLIERRERLAMDYNKCVKICGRIDFRVIALPYSIITIITLIVGVLFGNVFVSGFLIGGLISGIYLSASAINSGIAWNSTMRYYTQSLSENLYNNNDAVISADLVGRALKDVIGPLINTFLKVSAITAFIFADFLNSSYGGILLH